MDTSIFLAKFWGWYLIIFFLILSFRPKRIKQIFEDLHDEKFLLLCAFLAIIIGLLNVIVHNIWELNYKIFITGIGWLSLIIGLSLFIFPKKDRKLFRSSKYQACSGLIHAPFLCWDILAEYGLWSNSCLIIFS